MQSIESSIDFYSDLILKNTDELYDAKVLINELEDAIEYQVKQYSYCICKSSQSYLKWLIDEFKRKLTISLTKEYNKIIF